MDGSGPRIPPAITRADGSPAQRRFRLRAWLAESITHRVAASAALLATCVVLLLANRVGLLLASTERDVASLATNSLVVNGLLDSRERLAYLNPFLRDHVLPAQVPGRLTLVDHRGTPLASNVDGDAASFKDAAWLEPVLQKGKPATRLTEAKRLLQACPVVFPATGQPEGAVILDLPLEPLFAQAAAALAPNLSSSLLQKEVSLAERPAADRDGPLVPSETIAARRPLQASGAIDELGLQVEVSVPRAEALEGLGALARNVLLAGMLALLLSIWMARSAARRLLQPLVQLSRMAEKIRSERRFDVVVPEEGDDEIGQLAASFNHMIDSLRQAKDNLESEVAARTSALEQTRARLNAVQEQMNDGLLVVDSHGCVESFNAGAERLFDSEADEVIGRGVARLIPSWQATLAMASVDISAHGRFQRKIRARRGSQEFVADLSLALIKHDKLPCWVVLVRDVTEQERAEDMMQLANPRLSKSVAELQRRDEDMAQVNRLNELLAGCHSLDEAHAVIERTLRGLFDSHAGALAVSNGRNGAMDVVARWGEREVSQEIFALQDCWALRLGREHDAGDGQGVPCAHHLETGGAVTCLPLLVHGETLGLLMASFTPSPDADDLPHLNQLLRVVGEAIKFSLSNLKLREALRDAALRDGLTGLFSRRYLDETMPRELSRMRRAGRAMSVAVVDLDHFKRFNDGYGHEAGDLVLRETGRVLRESLRASDIACRVGGEELVVVLLDATAENAAMRLEQVRASIGSLVLRYGDQVLPAVTLSIGIAQAPEHRHSAEELLRAADRALYAAKAQGRDRIVIATAAAEEASSSAVC